MLIRLLTMSVPLVLLSSCGLLEEHERRDGETVYRIKPEAAVSIAQAVGSVIPEQPEKVTSSARAEPARTTYSLEVTGERATRRAISTITRQSVAICLSANDCLTVLDNGTGGPITGDFNGFEFVLSGQGTARFFHDQAGQERAFGLSPKIAENAVLAQIYVKNLGANVFAVRLRASDYPEYDIDAIVTFDQNGELVSCIARRLSTGQRTVIEDSPPNT